MPDSEAPAATAAIPFRLARLESHVFRVPIAVPVVTSFGIMRDRPALFVRAIDEGGAAGWGEVWCNFPTVGAEHRAGLISSVIAPLLLGRDFASPAEAFRHVSRCTEVLALQSGEPGPLAQAAAGVDVAVWDMLARRAGLPLRRLLGGGAACVPVYASGINPDGAAKVAGAARAAGHSRFKLKVGFGRHRDLANLRDLRETLGEAAAIMVDANQAWDFDEARRMDEAMAPFGPGWLEEPMRADVPVGRWAALAQACAAPIANGENLRGLAAFGDMIAEGGIAVVQPDIGKWGGFSGCVEVARMARQRGVSFCPHWLGGGIGLLASLHLLAAVGGPGFLEVDVNANPLRDDLVHGVPGVSGGAMAVPDGAGLGGEPDLAALEPFRVALR